MAWRDADVVQAQAITASSDGVRRDRSTRSRRRARELRAYGSRGQQRPGLLALLLAEREALAASRGTPPLASQADAR